MNTVSPKLVPHHLENLFDIEAGTTISKVQPVRHKKDPEIIEGVRAEEEVNVEDKAVSSQLETIYGYAIDAYEQQTQLISSVDARFAARNAEVAAQYLNIALSSANSRAKIRHDKLKLKSGGGAIGTVNNNLIVTASRADVLKMLMDAEKIESITA